MQRYVARTRKMPRTVNGMQKLDSRTILMREGIRSDSEAVRLDTVRGFFGHDNVLLALALRSDKADVRLAAVDYMQDPESLARVVIESGDVECIFRALGRLSKEIEILRDIAYRSDADGVTQGFAERRLVLSRLDTV